LFGALPEAFKAKPLVYAQCPGPGEAPGTCTMHTTRVDVAPVLAELGKSSNPPTANVFVPTPNHSHIVPYTDPTSNPEWWQVRPVLVLNAADWPAKVASSGVTSVAKLVAAINAHRVIDAPSNFFLYFGDQPMTMANMKMSH
jgi:hypothetical protein